MKKLVTLEELGRITHWGFHGTYFNTQLRGFPEPKKDGELENKVYDLLEVLEWDRLRPTQ